MLKVVGASWEKTRLTTIMLAIVLVLAILAIFFFEAPHDLNDGNYAATVYWSKEGGFSFKFWGQGNDPQTIKLGASRAYYKPDMSNTGWATLEVQTNPDYPDWVQAYAAGLIEGSLSWQVIYWHWENTVAYVCDSHPNFCSAARQYLQENSDNIKKEVAQKQKTDPLWHQVYLFYFQLDGLESGWRYGITRSRKKKEIDIPHVDFLWMNSVCDLRDLEHKFNISRDTTRAIPLPITLLKLLPDSVKKIVLAHSSAGLYTEMLRLQKRYSFGYHMMNDSGGVVPGQHIEFTSYPASIHSQDDFYHVTGSDNKLIVCGSAMKNYNSSLWNSLDYDRLLMGPRVMAANRISHNASEWSQLIDQSNSGTGIKQWLILKTEKDKTRMWVIEQIPGATIMDEQTQHLQQIGYWTFLGLPHYKESRAAIGYETSSIHSGIKGFYKDLEQMLHVRLSNVTDMESILQLMRSPEIAILGRSDVKDLQYMTKNFNSPLNMSTNTELKQTPQAETANLRTNNPFNSLLRYNMNFILENGKPGKEQEAEKEIPPFLNKLRALLNETKTYSETEKIQQNSQAMRVGGGGIVSSELSGNIDLKISTEDGNFQAAAGPPYSTIENDVKIEPFQWSKSIFRDIPHHGQSDEWKYEPVSAKWVWS